MENQENGQTDDMITKLVRVFDHILPSVGYSPNPLRVEEIDEVREDQLADLHLVPHNSNSLISNYRLFRRPPSTPKITPLTQC